MRFLSMEGQSCLFIFILRKAQWPIIWNRFLVIGEKGRTKGKLIGLKFLSSPLFLKRTEEQMEFMFLPVADRSNESPPSPPPTLTEIALCLRVRFHCTCCCKSPLNRASLATPEI